MPQKKNKYFTLIWLGFYCEVLKNNRQIKSGKCIQCFYCVVYRNNDKWIKKITMYASCSWGTDFDIFILRQQIFRCSFKIPKLWKNNGYVSLCLRLEKRNKFEIILILDLRMFFALNILCVSLDASVESLSSFARFNEQSVIIWTPSLTSRVPRSIESRCFLVLPLSIMITLMKDWRSTCIKIPHAFL